jgi:hypothetical protein
MRCRNRVRALVGILISALTAAFVIAPQAASANQGGCTTAWVEGFNLGACIDDNGTENIGYPDAYINYIPSPATCDIHIQVWDQNNNQYSDKQVGCSTGHYTGNPAGPVGTAVNLHAYARLDLNGTHFAVGDSPSFRVNGCNTYLQQGFSIGVCVNNQGTGNTAYPDIYVNSTPFPTSCAIQIQVWDNSNNQETGRQVPCTAGHQTGTAAGPFASGVTIHSYLRLDLNGARYAGPDSPAITLQAASTARNALISALQGATPKRYAMTDSSGQTMDTAQIFQFGGTYYAVYSPGSLSVVLASSPDLYSAWTPITTLDENGSQPYLALQSDNSFVLADENAYDTVLGHSAVYFLHFKDINALKASDPDKAFLTQLRFSSCNEGTPDIRSTDPNAIQVGFHYDSTCDALTTAHDLDREAFGTLTNWSTWTTSKDTARDTALTNAGFPGKHGGRSDVVWRGARFSLGEAKNMVDNTNVFTSWRLALYDYTFQSAYPVTLNLAYANTSSPCVGNPKASAMTDTTTGGNVLVVTAFFFSECAAPSHSGELMYVIPTQ